MMARSVFLRISITINKVNNQAMLFPLLKYDIGVEMARCLSGFQTPIHAKYVSPSSSLYQKIYNLIRDDHSQVPRGCRA